MAKLEQWVNLEKDTAYTNDGDGATLERCGYVTIQVRFKKNGIPIGYKVNVTPVGNDNVRYSAAELSRNPNFRQANRTRGISYSNEILAEDVRLPAAGGNTYRIEARDDKGNVVSTAETVIAKRKLYYQLFYMSDDSGSITPPNSLASLETHARKHHIELIKKGTKKPIPYMRVLDISDFGYKATVFADSIRDNLDLNYPLRKMGFAVVFCDYIAEKVQHECRLAMDIGTQDSRITWDGKKVAICTGALWHGLDLSDDFMDDWFIGGCIEYTDPSTGTFSRYIVNKSSTSIAKRNPRYRYGGFGWVEIGVDTRLRDLLNKPSGRLYFTLAINTPSFLGGYQRSHRGVRYVASAQRSQWDDLPLETREIIWNHELGHCLGMVAYGDKTHPNAQKFRPRPRLPDAPSTLYGENRGVNDQGHIGPHCSKGATYNSETKEWSGTPECVMFGGKLGDKTPPTDYCSECTPIARKLDLSG